MEKTFWQIRKKENKFGLTRKKFLELLKKYKDSNFIDIICLSVHIGSQITNHLPYKNMLNVVNKTIEQSAIITDEKPG